MVWLDRLGLGVINVCIRSRSCFSLASCVCEELCVIGGGGDISAKTIFYASQLFAYDHLLRDF